MKTCLTSIVMVLGAVVANAREPNYDLSRVGASFGYVRRGGRHGLVGYDWLWMLDFADKAFRR